MSMMPIWQQYACYRFFLCFVPYLIEIKDRCWSTAIWDWMLKDSLLPCSFWKLPYHLSRLLSSSNICMMALWYQYKDSNSITFCKVIVCFLIFSIARAHNASLPLNATVPKVPFCRYYCFSKFETQLSVKQLFFPPELAEIV